MSVAMATCSHADVTVDGLDQDLEDNVRLLLPLAVLACDASPTEIRRLYALAPNAIRRALEPYGYYHVLVTGELTNPSPPTDACWSAQFRVQPGEPTLIDTATIKVLGTDTFDSTIAQGPLTVGDHLNHQRYEIFRDQLRRQVTDAGYLDATYQTHQILVDPSDHTADINLILDSGTRYRIGAIDNHVTILTPDLLFRLLSVESGDWVSRQAIGTTKRDLLSTGYFASVDIQTTPNPTDHTLDVSISGTGNRAIEYTIGAGFSSDFGPFLTTDFTNRRVNRRGHRLDAQVDLGTVVQDVQLEYRVPGKRPLKDWFSFYAGGRAEDADDTIASRAINVGVRNSRSYGGQWRFEPFAEVTVDRVEENNVARTLQSWVPGAALTYRRVSAGDRPTGFTARFEVAAAHDALLSDASFLRAHATTRIVIPFLGQSRWLFRGEAGYLDTNDFDHIPTRWRFFAGGDSSVRGFDYRTLGPVDSNGDATGGSWVATASAELDVPVRDRWSVAFFADAGQVGLDDNRSFDAAPVSVGFGVRWLSPVGPVRVDFAFPMEGTDDSFRLHVGLGPDL